MRKSTYIDYAVLMAVRSGRKKKPIRGLMLIARASEENLAVLKSKQRKAAGLPHERYVSEGMISWLQDSTTLLSC